MKKKLLLTSLLLISFLTVGCANKKGEKIIVSTPNAPAAIGPYNQAIIYGSLVYTSGQIAIDPATNILVDGDITIQTHQVFKNVKAVLEAANSSLDNVLRCNVYLADMNDFSTMNDIYKTYFAEGNYPARSAVEVSGLPKGALIEIETIAIVK